VRTGGFDYAALRHARFFGSHDDLDLSEFTDSTTSKRVMTGGNHDLPGGMQARCSGVMER
jgi:hypothetical protein